MEQFRLGSYSLNDFADYLEGKNKFFEGVEGNELVIEGDQILSKTLKIDVPLRITGENAVIRGEWSENFLISVRHSLVEISNLEFKNVKFAIEVDGHGKLVENVKIKNITTHNTLRPFDIGSTLSNSVLRNILIEDCTSYVAYEDWRNSDGGEMALSYNICSARFKGGAPIDNCLIEGVVLNNCKKIGFSTAGISIVTGMPSGTDYTVPNAKYSNLKMRDITITNNFIDTCWDCSLVVIGAFINTGAGLVENLKIADNHIKYGIGAIGISAGNHHFGVRGNSVVRNLVINNNTVERSIEDVGEPTRAIWIYGCRDYVPGTITHDHLVENAEIANNKIYGAGIALKGAYVLLDVPAQQTNNMVKNVNIHHNEIFNADYAFEFYGVDIHGRLYDWNYGFPRHDQKWGEEIIDPTTINAIATGNRLEDISCTDNVVDGYRYRVKASGVNAHGHGLCKDNKVVENIVFENNHFKKGENHIHVQNFIADDYVRDGGGNEVSDVFKNHK